jgi:hypothetical protein
MWIRILIKFFSVVESDVKPKNFTYKIVIARVY